MVGESVQLCTNSRLITGYIQHDSTYARAAPPLPCQMLVCVLTAELARVARVHTIGLEIERQK